MRNQHTGQPLVEVQTVEEGREERKKRAQKKKEDTRLPSHSMLLLKVGIPRGRKTSRQLAIDDVAFQEESQWCMTLGQAPNTI